MSDLYHGEYPVDMTPAEAKAEIERREVKHSPREMQRLNDAIEDRAARMTHTTTDAAEARAREVLAQYMPEPHLAVRVKEGGDLNNGVFIRPSEAIAAMLAFATAEAASGAVMTAATATEDQLCRIQLLADVEVHLKSCRIFLTSREKMHPCGVELHDELLAKVSAAIEQEGRNG